MNGKLKILYLTFTTQALARLRFISMTNSRIGLPWSALKLLLALSFLSVADSVSAEHSFLRADYRQRPPEMVIDAKTGHFSGPLIDILDEAARKIDYRIKWRKAPFQRSYNELQLGSVDVVPRVILTEERKAFVAYLGPIGYQQKDIVFLVRKGKEGLINTYDDLRKISVGTKRDTAYFKRFNDDKSIKKILSLDDENMARMFAANRFHTIIILDIIAIETALENIGFNNFSYANYKYVQRIGNYYGMSKKSPLIELYPKLNQALLDLAQSGRVKEIYKNHGVAPLID